MEKDIFYEVPRLPMFIINRDSNDIERIRVLRYTNGTLSGYLADYDANDAEVSFTDTEGYDYENLPFYCFTKGYGDYVYNFESYLTLRRYCENIEKEDGYSAEEMYNNIINNAIQLGVPFFESIEEAREYVFGKSNYKQKIESMTLNEYQKAALETAVYNRDYAIIYPALGLNGEAGEVADKVKKVIRDNNGNFSAEKLDEIKKELGDVFWYVAVMASDCGFSLEEIATTNIEKLRSRKERGKIGGDGDNR